MPKIILRLRPGGVTRATYYLDHHKAEFRILEGGTEIAIDEPDDDTREIIKLLAEANRTD